MVLDSSLALIFHRIAFSNATEQQMITKMALGIDLRFRATLYQGVHDCNLCECQ